jgi:hypothetical protein
MRRRGLKCAFLALFLGALSVAPAVAARPGGGQAYRGDSSRSSGSSSHAWPSSGSSRSDGPSGDGGDVDAGLLLELLLFCFRYPPLGLLVAGGVVGFVILNRRRTSGLSEWSVGGMPARVEATTRATSARRELTALVESDPGFSLVLFEDFAYALYAELQVKRARGELRRLAAFLSPEVMQLLHEPTLERVEGVVIGALRYVGVERGAERTAVTLELEANLGEVRGGVAQRFYACDRLVLTRARTARSRPPGRTHKLDCPNCGAPLEGMRGTTCGYCGQEVGGGRLDWQVERIERLTT